MDLGGICRYWAGWQPEAVAVQFEGRPVTWAELDRRTDAISAGLGALGVSAGDRLGILGLTQKPLSLARIVGVALLALGVFLIVRE